MQNIEVSSAYIKRDVELRADGRSLVNKVNRVGPRTDPCGIPADTGSGSDLTPFAFFLPNSCLSIPVKFFQLH